MVIFFLVEYPPVKFMYELEGYISKSKRLTRRIEQAFQFLR